MSDLTRATINSISRPVHATGTPSSSQAIGMTPKEILAIFRRHIWMIISFTIAGLIVGGIAWFLCLTYIPKYTAITVVRVESPDRQDPTNIATTTGNKDILYQYRVEMAGRMTQESLFDDLLRLDDIRKTNWFKSFDNPFVDGIEKLKEDFRVSPQRESQLLTVSMGTPSPTESAIIVNSAVELFVNKQAESSKTDIQYKLQNLTAQETVLKRDLLNANNALDDWRASSGFTGLSMQEEDQHTINQKEQQLVLQLDNLENEISRLEEQIKTYESRVQTTGIDIVTQAQTEQDSIVLALKQEKAQIKTLLEQKQSSLGENHRTVKEIRERIIQTDRQIEERYLEIARVNRESQLTAAQDQQRSLETERATMQAKRNEAAVQLKGLENARAEYERLVTTRDRFKDSLDLLTKQIEKFQTMLNDPETPKIRKVAIAPKPIYPSFPKWQVFFPGGFILGFMMGAGLAFLVEFLNDKLRTPKDVATNIRIPLLGLICHSEEDAEVSKIKVPALVMKEAPHSMTSEFYRQLRTNLKKSLTGKQKIISITSGAGGEGRTSVAANLAVSFVVEGTKVVFVDANFRRPASLTIFPKSVTDMPSSVQQVTGLSNYLTGKCSLSDILRHCSLTGLDVIDSGSLPMNPSELLEGSRMDELLRQLSVSYDYVIIDSPPMLVADAKILAMKADGCVLVFNATKTRKGAAQRVTRELRSINANLLGCTLVAVRSLKGGYFDEMFKSYRDYSKPQLAASAK
jgi:capsular exopolysaccharide synthesis family protein